MSEKLIRYRGGDEWSALYVDGKLDRVGDHYWVEERIFELLGVEERYDDDFMRGQDHREGVAQTLEEIEEYTVAQEALQEEADELINQANELRARADAILKRVSR